MSPEATGANNLFKTVEREATLSAQVTEQIEELIVTRHLQPGDRLPAERELADSFGVSRTVVREAIHTLVAKGLLQAQPGGGSVVSHPTAEALAQSMSLYLSAGNPSVPYDNVNEVRRLLEVEIAGLAAQRRTEQDLANLALILEEAAQVGDDDPNHFARTDVAFHTALARATQNAIFALLLDSLADIMHEVRFTGFEVEGAPLRALLLHRSIFEQVRLGDAQGAQRAMSEHLDESEETQRRVIAKRGER
ncbi:MAG: FadR family transcriptional regulator [Caldilineaceae bacterium]|nr:FadR family transcriptional regulator [Caldilineaceae bacterium]